MTQAKQGDKVQVHYTGRQNDGEVFDSSVGQAPLEFTLGGGEVIPGFENGVVGMSVGEKRTVAIPPDEGYGPYEEQMVLEVGRDQFPDEMSPTVGQQLTIRQDGGQAFSVVVVAVGDEVVTLDANHPLAGQTLTFEIELVSIN
jgi:peptidylprolyl isomerase